MSTGHQRSTSIGPGGAGGAGGRAAKTYFEQQREALIGEIAMSFEQVLANINKLNRSLEAVITVGNEFSSVEALWSQFENVMAKDPDEARAEAGQGGGPGGGEGEEEEEEREDEEGEGYEGEGEEKEHGHRYRQDSRGAEEAGRRSGHGSRSRERAK